MSQLKLLRSSVFSWHWSNPEQWAFLNYCFMLPQWNYKYSQTDEGPCSTWRVGGRDQSELGGYYVFSPSSFRFGRKTCLSGKYLLSGVSTQWKSSASPPRAVRSRKVRLLRSEASPSTAEGCWGHRDESPSGQNTQQLETHGVVQGLSIPAIGPYGPWTNNTTEDVD